MNSAVGTNIKSVAQTIQTHYVFIFFIIFIIFSYFLYTYISNISTNVVITKSLYLKDKSYENYPNNKISTPSAKTSSFSVWIYLNSIINDDTSSDYGTIFQYINNGSTHITYNNDGANSTNCVFALYLKTPGDLIFTIKGQKFTVVEGFPRQIWKNVFINIYDMNSYEFYIDGKLVNSFLYSVSSTNPEPNSSIFIGMGVASKIDAVINNLVRWPYTQDSSFIWDNYNVGNKLNKTSYDLTVSIKPQDDTAYKSINLINFSSLNNVFS